MIEIVSSVCSIVLYVTCSYNFFMCDSDQFATLRNVKAGSHRTSP